MTADEPATRRRFLVAAASAFGSVVAGCSSEPNSNLETSQTTDTGTTTTPATETTAEPPGRNLPAIAATDEPSVYIPAHRDGMRMAGMKSTGPYSVAMSYTLLHDFWVLTGQERSYVRIENGQGMHLMASVWDPEYEQVIPVGSPSITVQDAESDTTVAEKTLWPMLSQQMGAHFGDNVSFPSEGEYTVRLSMNPVAARQLGDYHGRFTDDASVEFDLPFRYNIMTNIRERFVDDSGRAGAFEPMAMHGVPDGRLPEPADLPGQHAGEATSADAHFVAQVLEPTPKGIDSSDPYLAISARTPYNRYPLPFMGLRATIEGADGRRFRDILQSGIHPTLGYHYGAPVAGLSMGDTLTLEVGSPPQIARHRGYQTAFMDFDNITITLDGTD